MTAIVKNKRQIDEWNKQTAEAPIVESDSNGNVLFATFIENRSVFNWILHSGYTYHMCPYKD